MPVLESGGQSNAPAIAAVALRPEESQGADIGQFEKVGADSDIRLNAMGGSRTAICRAEIATQCQCDALGGEVAQLQGAGGRLVSPVKVGIVRPQEAGRSVSSDGWLLQNRRGSARPRGSQAHSCQPAGRERHMGTHLCGGMKEVAGLAEEIGPDVQVQLERPVARPDRPHRTLSEQVGGVGWFRPVTVCILPPTIPDNAYRRTQCRAPALGREVVLSEPRPEAGRCGPSKRLGPRKERAVFRIVPRRYLDLRKVGVFANQLPLPAIEQPQERRAAGFPSPALPCFPTPRAPGRYGGS